MKQFKAEWQHGDAADFYKKLDRETIQHLITQHNALCDYLAERKGESGAKEVGGHFYNNGKDICCSKTITISKPPWVKENHAWTLGYEQALSDTSKASGITFKIED